jgi:hypothetical protein
MSVTAEISELQQRVKNLRRQKRIRESAGIHFYKPHKKQDLFHAAGEFRRRYVRTGNRFGKSQMGAAEDIAWCMGERVWYPEDDPRRYAGIPRRPVKGCIVVQDWKKAKDIFTNRDPGADIGKLFQLLPSDKFVGVGLAHGSNVNCVRIKSKWGGVSSIFLETVKSFKGNKMTVESSDWDFLHIDEPCPKEMYTGMARGLMDRQGSAWFTCTPLTEMWINDMFIPPKRFRQRFDEPYGNTDASKWIITGRSTDNPYLTQAAIQDFLADIDEDERTTRLDGVPRALAGLVYKSFDREVHVVEGVPKGWEDTWPQPPEDYTVRIELDVHAKEPQTALFFATSPHGVTIIYDEIFDPCYLPDFCKQIEGKIKGINVYECECDPIAFQEHPVSGQCWIDDMEIDGVDIMPAPKTKERGISITQSQWKMRDLVGNPMMYVHEYCTEFLYEIDRYVWDPDKKGEKTTDHDDHCMECLYRGVLTGLDYVDPHPRKIRQPKPLDLTRIPTLPGSRVRLNHDERPQRKKLTKAERRKRYRI